MDETDSTSSYGGTWFAATNVDAPARPPLTVDLDVDVCVIGGGLAGLTTAREIARSGWSVVLIEADRLAAAASGRNTGFVLPGFAAAPDSIIGRVGFESAKDLWALSQSGVEYVRRAIVDDAMAGVDPRDGWLYVSRTDNGDEFTKLVGLLGEFGAEIEGWPTEQVRAVLRSERYFHAIHYPRAINIHPLNYALGLAAAAERAGARLFEHTPAISIDPAGVRKRIVTPKARLRASHVVLCGNVQIAGLMPPIGAALIPITAYVITTAPLGAALAEAVGYGGSVTDSDLAANHYRIVGGDRLMWCGRITTWQRNPRRYARALTAEIKRTFPQLGEVAVDYCWSGTLGNSIHWMPQIGELGPGVWLASGFGGHGLNTSAMAGNLIARAIVNGDQTWRRFTPFELVWAGGLFGRAVAQMYYWTRRLRAASAERRARSAELSRRTREMIAAKIEAAQIAERVEAERIEAERIEAERIEAERIEAERIEAERVEAERVEAERVEAERIEAERIEAERVEAERVEAERVEAERVEAERVEAQQSSPVEQITPVSADSSLPLPSIELRPEMPAPSAEAELPATDARAPDSTEPEFSFVREPPSVEAEMPVDPGHTAATDPPAAEPKFEPGPEPEPEPEPVSAPTDVSPASDVSPAAEPAVTAGSPSMKKGKRRRRR